MYGVNERRSRNWLLEWTKDGFNSISYGDSTALCLWEAWAPAVGCTYYSNRHGAGAFAVPRLESDEDDTAVEAELNAIYDWIAYRTKTIGPATVEHYTCDTLPANEHAPGTLQYLKRNSGGWRGLRRLSSSYQVPRLGVLITPQVKDLTMLDLSVVFPVEGFAVPLLQIESMYIIAGTQGMASMPWTTENVYLAGQRGGEHSGAVIKRITDTKTPLILTAQDFHRRIDQLSLIILNDRTHNTGYTPTPADRRARGA